jgi:hypothetical protein
MKYYFFYTTSERCSLTKIGSYKVETVFVLWMDSAFHRSFGAEFDIISFEIIPPCAFAATF